MLTWTWLVVPVYGPPVPVTVVVSVPTVWLVYAPLLGLTSARNSCALCGGTLTEPAHTTWFVSVTVQVPVVGAVELTSAPKKGRPDGLVVAAMLTWVMVIGLLVGLTKA